ncbi:MAG: lipase family protein, partial [Sterolibacterium sp.]
LAVTGLLPAPQIFDAMRFYLDVKAANPDATSFTFTGHSLGGGLAALMGVFFGRQAVTFDQAPFENSAESSLLHPDVAANLKQYLLDKTLADPGQATARDTLVSSLSKFQSLRQANGGIPNSNLVSTIRVDGEFLGTLPFDPIGAPATTLTHGSYFAPIDLHSQALLTTFLQSDAFRQMTSRLPELLGMVFDSSLFEYTTDTSNTRDRNLLEHLIRHQADVRDPATGTVSIAADAMLDRFTSDLDKLVRAQGGSQGYRDLGKALIAFAMEKYYTETTDSPKFHQELFRVVTGGLQFDTKDIAVDITTAKGYSQYFANYLDTGPLFTFEESRLIKQKIADLRDWSIQGANYPLDQDRSMVTDLMALQTDARDMDGNNDTLWRIAA